MPTRVLVESGSLWPHLNCSTTLQMRPKCRRKLQDTGHSAYGAKIDVKIRKLNIHEMSLMLLSSNKRALLIAVLGLHFKILARS